jgi:hypothetical protein
MTRFARRRPYLLAAIVVALIIVVLFGGRAAWRLAWRLTGPPPPRQTDVSLIADWMSVPYVSRAYRVPNPELYKALGVEPEGRRTRTIRDIAQDQGITSAQAVERVQAAVRDWQATRTGPGGAERERPPDAREPPWPPLPPGVEPETPWPPSPSPAS